MNDIDDIIERRAILQILLDNWRSSRHTPISKTDNNNETALIKTSIIKDESINKKDKPSVQ